MRMSTAAVMLMVLSLFLRMIMIRIIRMIINTFRRMFVTMIIGSRNCSSIQAIFSANNPSHGAATMEFVTGVCAHQKLLIILF